LSNSRTHYIDSNPVTSYPCFYGEIIRMILAIYWSWNMNFYTGDVPKWSVLKLNLFLSKKHYVFQG